jgi:transitional endoplasmic reticulum ATPase
MEEIQLKVAEAIQKDVGKGIMRIDFKIIDDITVSPRDIVEITDKKSTAAIATSACPCTNFNTFS